MQYVAALEEASGGAEALRAEREAKRARLLEWMERERCSGVLLRRHEDLAWITAGQLQARVAILSETGVAALLLLKDGRGFAIVPNNEAPRLEDEELSGLGFETIMRPWHGFDPAAEAVALGGDGIVADTPAGSLRVASLGGLRAPLLAPEIARYRALCRSTAEAVAELLPALEPGVSEYEMEARAADRLLRVGIFPSVLLMAVDERVLHYKHAVARGARLQRFGMLNLCTRRWGLACSITRFVHFGKLPPELEQGFAAAVRVNALLHHATRDGATAGELFRVAAEGYAAAGFPGEEQAHHQGGACGYLEREWVAKPTGREQVHEPEAFAWNPSCRGGKVEDTALAANGAIEVLTRTASLPEVSFEVEGVAYTAAAPLVRS